MFQRVISAFLIATMFLSPIQPLFAEGPLYPSLDGMDQQKVTYPHLQMLLNRTPEVEAKLELFPYKANQPGVVPYEVISVPGPARIALIIDVEDEGHSGIENQVLSQLVRHAAAQGTHDFDLEAINTLLREAGSHIHPDEFSFMDREHIYFVITLQDQKYTEEVVQLLSQFAKSASLGKDEIERAQRNLAKQWDQGNTRGWAVKGIEFDHELRETMLDVLGSIDTSQVVSRYQELYREENMRVTFLGNVDKDVVEGAMNEYFKFFPEHVTAIIADDKPITVPEGAQAIDGKILLNQPGFLGTRSSKKWFGWGITGLCTAIGTVVPGAGNAIGFFVGGAIGLSVATTSSPLDPIEAKENRDTLLSLNYTQASKDARFDELVTPREMRKAFMKEHIYGANIEGLTGINVNSERAKKILTTDERATLYRETEEYRESKALAKERKSRLDAQYQQDLKPSKLQYEARMREAQRVYDANPSVIAVNRLDKAYPKERAQIEAKKRTETEKARRDANVEKAPMIASQEAARKAHHEALDKLRADARMTPPPFNPAVLPRLEKEETDRYDEEVRPHEEGIKWVMDDLAIELKKIERKAKKALRNAKTRYEIARAPHGTVAEQAKLALASSQDWAKTAFAQAQAETKRRNCYHERESTINADLSASKHEARQNLLGLVSSFETKTNGFDDFVNNVK